MSGKYFVTEHLVTNLLGAQQVGRNWYYWEISQNGSALTANVVYNCGARVDGLGSFAAAADDSQAWPSFQAHDSYAGRTGTVTAASGGCQVMWNQMSVVHGASPVSAYNQVGSTLPTIDQKYDATTNTPGWEDWDADGNPGITLNISGTATGQLYCVTNFTSAYTGTVSPSSQPLTYALDWQQDRSNLGSTMDPLGILRANAGRDGNDSLHFVQFAKLTDAQATADNTNDLCTNIMALADTLTPAANALNVNPIP